MSMRWLALVALGVIGEAWGASTEPPARPGKPLVEVPIDRALPADDEPLPTRAIARFGRYRDIRGVETAPLALPDGKSLAAGFADRRLRVWRADTGELLGVSPVLPDPINAVAVSPDGRLFAIAGRYDIFLLDRETLAGGTPAILPRLHQNDLVSLIFSPDGKNLISIGRDKRLARWDIAQKLLEREATAAAPDENLASVALTTDGKSIATLTSSGRAKLWKFNDLREVREFEKLASGERLHMMPDGKSVACMTWNDGVVFWSVETGRIIRRLPNLKGFGGLSPDGRWLAVAPHAYPATAAITLYDLKEDREAGKLPGHVCETHHFCFSTDSTILHTYGLDHTSRHWDVARQQEVRPPTGHGGRVMGVALVDGDATLATCSQDGTLRFWNARTGREERRLTCAGEYFQSLAISPDGGTLSTMSASAPIRYRYWEHDADKNSAHLHQWNLAAKKAIESKLLPSLSGRGLQYSPDGKQLMMLNADHVRLFDVKTGRDQQPVPKATHHLHAAALSPDGRWLVISTDQPAQRQIGRIGYWDLADGKEQAGRSLMFASFNALAFSPDGKFLAVAGGGGHKKETGLSLWETPTDKIARAFKTTRFDFQRVAYSPDGRLLAAADMDGISIFETATGDERWRFADGHIEPVNSLAFSADSKRLATGGDDGLAYVWDLVGPGTGKLPLALDEARLLAAWKALGNENGPELNAALAALIARPADSVPFLRGRLGSVSAVEQKRIDALIIDLDHDQFRVRDAAARQLESLGELAVASLVAAARDVKRSAEVRDRASVLVKRIGAGDDPATSAVARQSLRAIEALEHADTPPARALLDDLAARGRTRLLQEEAAKSVNRRDSAARP
jgi:WD40 repeat protein